MLCELLFWQCLLHEILGVQLEPFKELQKDEVESVVRKLKEATLLEAGQSSVWSTLGLLLLRSGRIQVCGCRQQPTVCFDVETGTLAYSRQKIIEFKVFRVYCFL